jgi:hypothetical protein
MKCVYCGCTEEKACRVEVETQSARAQLFLAAAAAHMRAPMPRMMSCSWFETDPPVCSAPACVAKHAETLTHAPDAP